MANATFVQNFDLTWKDGHGDTTTAPYTPINANLLNFVTQQVKAITEVLTNPTGTFRGTYKDVTQDDNLSLVTQNLGSITLDDIIRNNTRIVETYTNADNTLKQFLMQEDAKLMAKVIGGVVNAAENYLVSVTTEGETEKIEVASIKDTFESVLNDLSTLITNLENGQQGVHSYIDGENTKEIKVALEELNQSLSTSISNLNNSLTQKINTDVSTLKGNSTDSKDDITVYGVRNRVDNLDTTINKTVEDTRNELVGNDSDTVTNLTIKGVANSLNSNVENLNKKIDDTKTEIIGSDTDDKDYVTLKGLSKAIEDTNNTLGKRIDDITLSDETVYLSGPYTLTKDFGYYKLNGKSSIQVGDSNTTLREFLSGALAETSVGTIDYPSYSYTSGSTTSSGEVGSSFSAPICTFKVTDVGSYQYGPDTGISFSGTLTTDGVTDKSFSNLSTNGTATITAKSGGTYTTETQTITFGGTYSYTKGATPKTNIGTTDSSKAIAAKSNQTLSHSRTYTGYYKTFMGIGNVNNISSTDIRKLTGRAESKSTYSVDASVDDVSIIWAIRKGFTTNKPTFTYELFGNYETLEGVVGPTVVSVKDAGSGYNDYNVYTYTPAAGKFTAAMKTKITIN